MSTTGFHHIALRTADYDKSVAFYSKGLGFREKIRWGKPGSRCIMLDFGDGGCLEIFEGTPDLPKDGDLSGTGRFLHLAIRTTDTRELFRMAMEAGATVSSEPEDLTIDSQPQPTPVTIAFVYGPDGELLEFFQER